MSDHRAKKRKREDSRSEDETKKQTKKARATTPAVSGDAHTTVTATTRDLECVSALLMVGTYQGLMIGLVLRGGRFYLKCSTKHHTGSLSSVVANDKVVASCGTDEQLFLFTTKRPSLSAAAVQKMREKGEAMGVRMADLGNLSVPSEVVCMQLSVGSSPFLFCGTIDGQLLVYRARDWALCTTMAIHDRAMVGIAIHPCSHGTLAVTVSTDRSVAVLDLAKEKLLTKWKYFSAARSSSVAGGGTALLRRHREEPEGVVFAPSGKFLVVYSANGFQVYDSASMSLTHELIYATMQPSQEIHSLLIIQVPGGDEEVLIVGDELGALRCCVLPPPTPTEGDGVVSMVGEESLPIIPLHYSESVAAQLAGLPSQVDADLEARRKNPLRHISRLKAICKEGCTLFTMDARGVVMCWKVVAENHHHKESSGVPFSLHYVASAACQGRATSMCSLWL